MITLQLPSSAEQHLAHLAKQTGQSVGDYAREMLLAQLSKTSQPVIDKGEFFDGNVKKLKGIVKTDLRLTVEEMNEAIAQAGVDNMRYLLQNSQTSSDEYH